MWSSIKTDREEINLGAVCRSPSISALCRRAFTRRFGRQGWSSSFCIVIYSCGRVGLAQGRYTRVNEAVRREWVPALACLPNVDVACHWISVRTSWRRKTCLSVCLSVCLTRITCEPVSAVKLCVDGVQPGTFHVSARTVPLKLFLALWRGVTGSPVRDVSKDCSSFNFRGLHVQKNTLRGHIDPRRWRNYHFS